MKMGLQIPRTHVNASACGALTVIPGLWTYRQAMPEQAGELDYHVTQRSLGLRVGTCVYIDSRVMEKDP